MQLEGIDHVAMGVRDIERSAKWYIDVLGFERLHDGMWNGVPTFIGKGNTGIALFPANQEPKTSAHREIRMLHLAFRANRENFLAAQQRTREARNQIRIPGSRNLALDLFPRSRRPPARDYDLRGRVARRTSRFSCREVETSCNTGRLAKRSSTSGDAIAAFFFSAGRDTVRCDRLLALNADPEDQSIVLKSVNYLVAEYRKSGKVTATI